MNTDQIKRYKWVLIGALAVTLLCLYPQFVMWATRGAEWNGAYAQVHGDEWIYSAYVQALIDGRPRRNDSYTGRDDRPGETQPESIFSIQFIPAYLIAIPSRILGISSSTAFIIHGILTPLLSYLAIFWLLRLLLKDDRLAAAGAVVVICFGAMAGGQGVVHLIETGSHYLYLPFLRRYAPATMFPLFFLFCGFVWKSLTENGSRSLAWAIAAGLSIAILIFSYFYLWTAAFAWLAGLALLWLLARRDLKRGLLTFGPIFVLFVAAVIPFLMLESRRMKAMDAGINVQLTRAPDLLRVPELFGLIVIALIVFGVVRRKINWRTPEPLFCASFGLLPFLVFNQQIITGRAVQPYHYSLFIANYVSLVGLVIALTLLWRAHQKRDEVICYRWVARIAILALWWGAVEVVVHTRVMMRESDVKDRIAAPGQRLRQLSAEDVLNTGRDPRPLVLATSDNLAIMIPTFAPQALLWAQNFAFINIDKEENRRRLYQYLYYSGFDGPTLREDLTKPSNRFGTAIFGHARIIQYLAAVKEKPITADEIDKEVKQYEAFIASFNADTAREHVLSYLVYPATREPDLTNLDRWYNRDTGKIVGDFKIYRLRLKPSTDYTD